MTEAKQKTHQKPLCGAFGAELGDVPTKGGDFASRELQRASEIDPTSEFAKEMIPPHV